METLVDGVYDANAYEDSCTCEEHTRWVIEPVPVEQYEDCCVDDVEDCNPLKA